MVLGDLWHFGLISFAAHEGRRSDKIPGVWRASAQQNHKRASVYMTHPIHPIVEVCFHAGGVRRQCPAFDGASTSIGAARPRQGSTLSGRCRAKVGSNLRPLSPIGTKRAPCG
jgi:hypothetical protein